MSFIIFVGWNTWNDTKLADEYLKVCGAGEAAAKKIIMTEHPAPEGSNLKPDDIFFKVRELLQTAHSCYLT